MAWASTPPQPVVELLRKLKERHPDWTWTLSDNIAIQDGHTLTGSNDVWIRHVDWTGHLEMKEVIRMADRLTVGIDLAEKDPEQQDKASQIRHNRGELKGEGMTWICGFFAVNQRHCIINNRCVVCKIKV